MKIKLSLWLGLAVLTAVSQQASAQILYQNNFDQYTTERVYTDDDLDNDWDTPVFNDGVTEGRVSIVGPAKAFGGAGSALEVFYPAGKDGTKGTGAQWQLDFDRSYEEAWLRYRFKFRSGFDFVRGGKLPGFAGGTAPTGSRDADGTNGFAARLMWRTDFRGVSGVPEQTVTDGISYAKYTDSGFDGTGEDEDREYWHDADGTRTMMQSGVWYEVIQRVKMNDPGVRNGVLQIWLDGRLVLDQQDILWRTANTFAIDQVYFSTFFGGNEDWRTSKDEVVYFDDFLISQTAIESDVDGDTDADPEGATEDEETDDVETDDVGTEEEVEEKEPRFIRVPEDYDTIQAGIDAACDGDTVAVNGQWVANVVVDKAILFHGYNATRITAANNNLPVLSIVADGVHVRQLELRNGTNGVRTDAGLSDIQIERITTLDSSSSGILVRDNCDGAYLKRNEVFDSGSHGILVSRSDDVQVVDCEAYFSAATGISIFNSSNALVEDCTAWGNDRGFSATGDSHTVDDNFAFRNVSGAFVFSGNNHTIHNNYSRLNGRGFAFAFSSGNRLTENVSREDKLNAFQFRLLSDDNVAINNIANFSGGLALFIDLSSGNFLDDFLGLRGRGGVVMSSSSASNEIQNSLIQDNAQFGIIDHGDGNTFQSVTERRNGD